MTAFSEENISAFFERSNQFAQDDHNMDLLVKYIKYQRSHNRELSIEALAEFIRMNSGVFHWLRDEKEIAAAVEAAKPKPEPPQKLKGLTRAEKLYQVGVIATTHLSHADRAENDSKTDNVIQKMAKEAAKTQREIERRAAIDEARSIVIYRAGRVSHGETADARRKALAALGVKE